MNRDLCPECDWPFYTDRMRSVTCPRCGTECVVGTGEGGEAEAALFMPSKRQIAQFHRLWRAIHRFPFSEDWSCSKRCQKWAELQESIPSVGCGCKRHWEQIVKDHPPTFRSRDAFFAWSVKIHNLINAKLGKPEIGIEAAMEAHSVHPDWPEDQQPMTDRLVAVTSLSPLDKHQQTQPPALDSWQLAGLEIVAVNTPDEIDQLGPRYPQVRRWVASRDQGTAYNFPTQRINAMCGAVTDRPFMVINSDIEIRGPQGRLIEIIDSGRVGVGIRHNYLGHWRGAIREGWGIDAFVMTPEQARTLPQLPFAIGRPMWDYWLPYHFDHIGQPMDWIGEPFFFHHAHPVHWQRSDIELGRRWLEAHYGTIEDWEDIRDRWPFAPPEQWRMIAMRAASAGEQFLK